MSLRRRSHRAEESQHGLTRRVRLPPRGRSQGPATGGRPAPATGGTAQATSGAAPATSGRLAADDIWAMLGLPATGSSVLGSPIRVGSVCSGMMSEHWSLERLPWEFLEVFWCEPGSFQRQFLKANIGPQTEGFFDVLSDEFLNAAPQCDLLIGGFPCQTFSVAGKGLGVHDKSGRGVVVLGILRYVERNMPRIVVLENVKGLVDRHKGVLANVVKCLEALGYIVSWRLLDMHIHGGVPCRRFRVYIVALKSMAAIGASSGASSGPATSGSSGPATGGSSGPATGGSSGPAGIVWPQPIPCADLSTIFDDTPKVTDYNNYPFPRLCKTLSQNLRASVAKVMLKAKHQGRDPADISVVADLGGTKVSSIQDIAPCLTKSRGSALAFWSIQHARALTVREMCKLQGLDSDTMNINVTPHQMGALLGNGFACTVMARVIAAAIQAAEREATGSPSATGSPPATDGRTATASNPASSSRPVTGGSRSTGSRPATSGKPATGGSPATGGRPTTGGNPASSSRSSSSAAAAVERTGKRKPCTVSSGTVLRRRSDRG